MSESVLEATPEFSREAVAESIGETPDLAVSTPEPEPETAPASDSSRPELSREVAKSESDDTAETTPRDLPPEPVAPLKAPQSWRLAAKAKFAGLDREVQEEMHRIEKEKHRVIQRTAGDRQVSGGIRQASAPH